MKQKEYDKQSWHAILYKSTYGEKKRYIYDKNGDFSHEISIMPDNICEYGKKLILAILVAPFSWLGHLTNFYKKKYDIDSIWTAWHFPFAMLVGMLFFKERHWSFDINFFNILKCYVIGLLIIVACIIAVAIVVAISDWWEDVVIFKKKVLTKEQFDAKYYKVKKPNPIVEYYKAFKGKYCAKINWK